VTVLATFLATSLILATLCLTDSVDVIMQFHFEKVRREDLSLSLQEPMDPQVLTEIARLADLRFVLATHSPYIAGEGDPQMMRLGPVA